MMHLKIDVIFNHTQLKIQYPVRRSSHDTLVKKSPSGRFHGIYQVLIVVDNQGVDV